ncbi:MAG: tRNA (N(6)-L-threonylcarbamoyladenosine(37)-C(2))-methylthiotransferase MtaB [Firmicutes bacterium]|nr:tRNA (N(6)-L-threonylcarbamoyladenosine(37)-C(2))-methylthiotransferase MtaB [Bacillota bacterium]
MKVAFHTLGCKVNQYDTEAVINEFKSRGYTIVDFDEVADIYVINTCTVTNVGDRKSRQMIRRAHRQNPQAKVVVMGCYSQTSPEEAIEIEGVNLVLGTRDRQGIVDLVESLNIDEKKSLVKDIFELDEFEEIPVVQFEGRTRATIKVQDGCNQFCSYCKVPYARGKSRSRLVDNVLSQVKEISDQGYREIVLTGVHLGLYGRDLNPPVTLENLVKLISEVPGIKRVRISSIDPNEIEDSFLEMMAANPKICPHLHIPLQSGSDTILSLMRRRYSTDDFEHIVEKARQMVPGIGITTDVIVGFPGEDEKEFAKTLAFAEKMKLSRVHVFQYSPRSGTPAATMPNQVPKNEKEQRSKALIDLATRLGKEFHSSFVNEVLEVLVEENEGVIGVGLTGNYIRTKIKFPNEGDWVGKLIKVRVLSANEDGIEGEFLA